jgi:hypothetical protein
MGEAGRRGDGPCEATQPIPAAFDWLVAVQGVHYESVGRCGQSQSLRLKVR